MNLLIYVTALLLSLSALSYHSLQKFLNSFHSQALWDRELKEESFCRFNESVEKEYRKLSKTPSIQDEDYGDEKDASGKNIHPDASAVMNFRFFVDEEIALKSPNERALYVEAAKKLIEILYGEQEFYQTKMAQKPDLLESFFAALLESNKGDKKIGKVENVNQLYLNDPYLREFFYAISKKVPLGPQAEQALLLGKKKTSCEATSFIEFLSQKKAKKIRVFLAPSALLLALFQNRETVLSIIEMRKQLHKDITNNNKTVEEANKEFSSAFSGSSTYQEILDFSTGKTAPP